jgi:transcriptional regulator with XRE-family HTH domain
MSKFADVIRQQRQRKGWSQAELAEKIGAKSGSFVTLVEAGKRGVNIDDIPSIANALELDGSALTKLYIHDRYPHVYTVLFGAEIPNVVPEAPGSFIPDMTYRLQSLPRELRSPLEALIAESYALVHRQR